MKRFLCTTALALIGLAISGGDLLARGGGRSGSGRGGSRMSRPATKFSTKSPRYRPSSKHPASKSSTKSPSYRPSSKYPSRDRLDRHGHLPRHHHPSYHHPRHRHPPYHHPYRWRHGHPHDWRYTYWDCPWCCPPWEYDDLFEDEGEDD